MFHISAEACFMAWVAWGLCCYVSTAAWKTEVVVLCAAMSVPPFVSCVGRNVVIYSILMPPRTHFWALNVKLGGESSRCWKKQKRSCMRSHRQSPILLSCMLCWGKALWRFLVPGSWLAAAAVPVGPWALWWTAHTIVAAAFRVPKPSVWWEKQESSSFLAVTFVYFSTR